MSRVHSKVVTTSSAASSILQPQASPSPIHRCCCCFLTGLPVTPPSPPPQIGESTLLRSATRPPTQTSLLSYTPPLPAIIIKTGLLVVTCLCACSGSLPCLLPGCAGCSPSPLLLPSVPPTLLSKASRATRGTCRATRPSSLLRHHQYAGPRQATSSSCHRRSCHRLYRQTPKCSVSAPSLTSRPSTVNVTHFDSPLKSSYPPPLRRSPLAPPPLPLLLPESFHEPPPYESPPRSRRP